MSVARRQAVLHQLSDWRLWTAIAYFWIVIVIVALLHLNSTQTHERSVRLAASRAAATTQVAQCYSGVRSSPTVDGFIGSVRDVITSQLITTRETLNITAPGTRLYTIRVQSLTRLRKAQAKVRALHALIERTTPSLRQCDQLSARLHVDPAQFKHPNPGRKTK